jgi:hypothetical protein
MLFASFVWVFVTKEFRVGGINVHHPKVGCSGESAIYPKSLRHLGGALARPSAVQGEVGHRDAQYLLIVLSPLDGFDIGAVRPVHQCLIEALAPWTTGRCLNYMYSEKATTYQVRIAYDPANIFRHNIPAGERGPND